MGSLNGRLGATGTSSGRRMTNRTTATLPPLVTQVIAMVEANHKEPKICSMTQKIW